MMKFEYPGSVRTWSVLDSAARRVRSSGIGKTRLDASHWQSAQKTLSL
jgi:hypothetical protein